MLLLRLALRNLLRQKRRNLMLGSAMAIGVAILVTAGSFSAGVSDIMFNKIMRFITGHVAVRFNERGGVMREIFRDRGRILAAVQGDPLIEEWYESVAMFARAIGNGKSDNIILVGMDASKGEATRADWEASFRLVEGDWASLVDGTLENPAVFSQEKARSLNVKMGDVVRVRFRDMFGQDQAARLTVAGIMRNDNIFMQPVVFLELERCKRVLGYRPHETASLSLQLKDARRDAAAVAARLHARLAPGTAVIPASAGGRPVRLYGYRSDPGSREKLLASLRLKAGSQERALRRDGVLVPEGLAAALRLSPGGKLKVSWPRKFGEGPAEASLTVSAVYAGGPPGAPVLLNDRLFYGLYYPDLPAVPSDPDPPAGWAALLSPEWTLLERTFTTEDYKKKYQEIARDKHRGTTVDVSTMYETASDILKLEHVLNVITLSAVLILFFIILLGVVNTLRMTIRERTREIGTARAIGMQRRDVRDLFLLETLLLTVFSSAAGVLAGFGAMALISAPVFHPKDNPLGMLLVDGRVYFLPTFAGIAASVLLIIAIALATAWFPARRAAAMSPAQALRHYG
ncbi:MAG: ABC transporter permease [Elusimicrobiales bacterium]|nr:ABC transporter permease [Elusimicrobiales bacterium]